MKASEDARVHSYLEWRSDITNRLSWRAKVFEHSAIFALFLGIAVLVSLLVLEAGAAVRWKAIGAGRWIACRVADFGPMLFLATSVVLLFSFRPIAQMFEQYRSAEQFNSEGMGMFWQVYLLGTMNPLAYFSQAYHQWLIGTIALAAIAVTVLVRGFTRQKNGFADSSLVQERP
jgi:hypothetical protein